MHWREAAEVGPVAPSGGPASWFSYSNYLPEMIGLLALNVSALLSELARGGNPAVRASC